MIENNELSVNTYDTVSFQNMMIPKLKINEKPANDLKNLPNFA